MTLKTGRTSKDWLKEPIFYLFGAVYMLVRGSVNVTMTVLGFYLNEVTDFKGTDDNPTPVSLALVPLCSYFLSLIFSIFIQQRMTRYLKNRLLPMLVGVIIVCLTSIPLIFLDGSSNMRYAVYPLFAF